MAAGVVTTSVNYSSSQPSAAPLNRSQMGGYDANFVSPISADYLCPICQLAFRDPVQTRDCGHRFCESCLEPILRWVIWRHWSFKKYETGILNNLFKLLSRKPPAFCPIDRRTLTREKVRFQTHMDDKNWALWKQCHLFSAAVMANVCSCNSDIHYDLLVPLLSP